MIRDTQSAHRDNRESTLFSWLHIYCAHLASVGFEHSVYRGSLMIPGAYIYIYIYIYKLIYIYIYIYISTWDHKWSTIHRVLKSHRSKMGTIYMQSWKQCALSVIPVSTLCVADHLWPLILRSLLSSLSIIWFVGTSNV